VLDAAAALGRMSVLRGKASMPEMWRVSWRAQQRAHLRDLLGTRSLHNVRLAEAVEVVRRPARHDEEARVLYAEQIRRRVATVRVVVFW